MVLHGSHANDESEDEAVSARNARRGRVLFVAYLALYIGYVGLVAFRPDLLRTIPAAGVNLAVLYGFALIVAALLTALLYGVLCRVPNDVRKETP